MPCSMIEECGDMLLEERGAMLLEECGAMKHGATGVWHHPATKLEVMPLYYNLNLYILAHGPRIVNSEYIIILGIVAIPFTTHHRHKMSVYIIDRHRTGSELLSTPGVNPFTLFFKK